MNKQMLLSNMKGYSMLSNSSTVFSEAARGYKEFQYYIISNSGLDDSLTPIRIDSIKCGETTLTFKNPLYVEVKKEILDGDIAYTAANKEFHIDIFDDSIENLKLAIEENICFLWETYVLADDNKLTNGAKKIKDFYLNNVIE